MALHAAARFHAFVHRLWNPSYTAETRSLYDVVDRLFKHKGIGSDAARASFISTLVEDIAAATGISIGDPRIGDLSTLVRSIFDFENLLVLPHIDWSRTYTIAEHWSFQERLREQRRIIETLSACRAAIAHTLTNYFNLVYAACPPHTGAERGISFSTALIGNIPKIGEFVESIIAVFFDETEAQAYLFSRHRECLNRNLVATSGGDPEVVHRFTGAVKLPSVSPIKNSFELVETYLRGTPIRAFLDQHVVVTISDHMRVEHCHVIGGTGHGKTQLLQHMLLRDLGAARTELMSMVVIDSQGDLIRKLSALKVFDPSDAGSLSSRFLLIDPADIDHPPALNLFDPGMERMKRYTPQQREAAFNSLVDIYGRFFDTLLGAELTARQGAVFRYLARLMLTIEGATIHTLIELMDDIGPFRAHIAKLDPTARRFFEKEFSRSGFNATRQQIKQRLYAVLSIPTFDRLFSAKRSKINFFEALNAGRIILVNTSKDLLKSDGTAIFGRFILSLIEHAILERATLPEAERTLTYLYVDEAQDYFDETIETLLTQGRKFNFGITLAHQSLAQLSPRLKAVIMGNTTIKLAGGVSDSDARALASDMRTTPDMLLAIRKFEAASEFALSVRNLTPHALTIDIPLGLMEGEPTLDSERLEALLQRNHERVGYPSGEPETPTADSAERQREKRSHTDAQRKLAEQARARGFGVEIEYALPDGKRIDLALFGHQLSIAIEVSVTNREAYELANIQKALDASFDHVWMIADDLDHREKINAQARQALSSEALSRVLFGSCEDGHAWLSRFTAPTDENATIAGYDVKMVLVPPLSPNDHDYRREQLRYLLSSRRGI